MALYTCKDGACRQVSTLYTQKEGVTRTVSTAYTCKNGAWSPLFFEDADAAQMNVSGDDTLTVCTTPSADTDDILA